MFRNLGFGSVYTPVSSCFQIYELATKVEKCNESTVDDLEREKESLTQEQDELQRRLKEYDSKYSKLEAQCKSYTLT